MAESALIGDGVGEVGGGGGFIMGRNRMKAWYNGVCVPHTVVWYSGKLVPGVRVWSSF